MAGGNKTLWIVANFKSKMGIKASLDWVSVVGPKLLKRDDLKVVVTPSYSSLSEIKKAVLVGGFPLLVASQDISQFPPGAYTGEEPAEYLKEFISLAIIGHSERRENFKETDEVVAKKVSLAKKAGIVPLVCIQSGNTPVPEGVSLVAYEPIFAIGSGNPDTPENADKVGETVKKSNPDVKILYGGSVNETNIKGFLDKENINGVLIGSASLNPMQFLEILKNFNN